MNETKRTNFVLVSVAVIVIASVFWVGIGWLQLRYIDVIASAAAQEPDWANRLESSGQFGDMFGSTNALFSALAFSILIVTVCMQYQELTLQRKELELSRKAQEGSASSQEKLAKAYLLASMISGETALVGWSSSHDKKQRIQDLVDAADELLDWSGEQDISEKETELDYYEDNDVELI